MEIVDEGDIDEVGGQLRDAVHDPANREGADHGSDEGKGKDDVIPDRPSAGCSCST